MEAFPERTGLDRKDVMMLNLVGILLKKKKYSILILWMKGGG